MAACLETIAMVSLHDGISNGRMVPSRLVDALMLFLAIVQLYILCTMAEPAAVPMPHLMYPIEFSPKKKFENGRVWERYTLAPEPIIISDSPIMKRGMTNASMLVSSPIRKYIEASYSVSRKKDNPAVELIRNVIARKDSNRVECSDYFCCRLYEKLTLSLDDYTPDFDKKKRRSI